MDQNLLSLIYPHWREEAAHWSAALARAQELYDPQQADPAQRLDSLGYRLELAPLSVPGATVYGRIDKEERVVYLDLEALDTLLERTQGWGEGELDLASASTLIWAHELYHALERRPRAYSELAAQLFALLSLGYDPQTLRLQLEAEG